MKKKSALFLTFLILTSTAKANASFAFSCPNKFIATVTNVEDLQNVGFPKVEVNFQVIQSLKGDTFESKKIQVVKDGPIEFKTGQTYTVETRDNWLCNASVLSQN